MKIFEVASERLTKSEFKKVLTPEVRKLGNLFKQHGFELRVVGGAVRDLLLGKVPKDVDFATDATPTEMINFLESAGWHTIPTGLEHGTISVLGELDEPYEITTLRIDVETTGRHAEVEFTRDFEKDAERRDLTFNAMSIDMNGKIYDYFGGINDLRNHVARFVGSPEERIQEDYLRILRYFRFQGRMDQAKFDEETKNAIRNNAKGLQQISGERVWAEMQKIFLGNHIAEILASMCDLGVAQEISLPCTQQIQTVDSVSRRVTDPATVLAYITDTEEQMNEIIARWKLSNKFKDLYKFLLSYKKNDISETDAKIYLSKATSKEQKFWLYELLRMQNKEDILRKVATWAIPEFPVAGKDLISLGIKPGPLFGEILTKLRNAWEESGFESSKEELLTMVGDYNEYTT